MTAAFRAKSFPEILANAFARARGVKDAPDLNRASWVRTILEIASLSDADAHVQINKLLKYFTLDRCKGDDLDRRALDLGTLFRVELRRLQARGATVKVSFSSGAVAVSGHLLAGIVVGATTFSLLPGEGDAFPTTGGISLERGTARFEKVVYTRVGDVFTVVGGTTYAHAAYGEVARVATQSVLSVGILVGGTSATLVLGTESSWPLSGSVVLDRATTSREIRTFTRSGNVLTLGAGTTFAHAIGGTAHLSTTGSDSAIGVGQQVYVQATESSKQVTFQTTVATTLFDGDLYTDVVDALCLVVGADTNVGSGTVRWMTSPPFAGAAVTNPLPGSGGRDREIDDAYLLRLKNFIASWGGRSGLSIEENVVGLFDEVSNSRVAFAQVVDPVVPSDPAILYITDGTANFALEREVFVGRDVAISDATIGDSLGRLHQAAPYVTLKDGPYATRTPRVYASIQRGSATSVGVNFLEDTAQSMVVNAYANMYLKTADDQFYRITSNTAIRFVISASGGTPLLGSYAVVDFSVFSTPSSAYIVSSSTATSANTLTDTLQAMTVNVHAGRYLLDSAEHLWLIISNTATAFTLDAAGATPAAGAYRVVNSIRSLPLVLGTDYAFNETNGHLQVLFTLAQHDAVVAAADGVSPTVGAYTFAKGLAALVQRAVNGDSTDFADFPGLKSHGAKILVVVPVVISRLFVLSVLPKPRVSFSQIVDIVKAVVQAYINSLGVGEEVILSEIVKLVKLLPGVADVKVIDPPANLPVADGQLARITADDLEVV